MGVGLLGDSRICLFGFDCLAFTLVVYYYDCLRFLAIYFGFWDTALAFVVWPL